MTIKCIQRWQTSDGTLFDSENNAALHEGRQLFIDGYDGLPEMQKLGLGGGRRLCEWLLENKTLVQRLYSHWSVQ